MGKDTPFTILYAAVAGFLAVVAVALVSLYVAQTETHGSAAELLARMKAAVVGRVSADTAP
jgi:hypothetical protein